MKPSFLRRLSAFLYDLLIIISLCLLFTFCFLWALNHGEAIKPHQKPYFQMMLFLLMVGYFAYFWIQRGQTTGMVAWKLYLISTKTEMDARKEKFLRPSKAQILIRLITALISCLLFGLGFIWCIFDKERRTLYDMASKTKIIQYNFEPFYNQQ